MEISVRYLEKIIIFAIMLMVLIYTVRVDRNPPKNDKIPISKQEALAPEPQPASTSPKSFFPESVSSPEDEAIIEETFTEIP
jgi:hypothetical protein